MGRRNLNPNQIAYLRGKRYETEKKIQGAPIGNKNAEKQSSHLANLVYSQPKTSEVLGSEYGVHKSTIIRNANFAKVVDILPEEVKHDVLSGEEKISRTMTDTILDFDKPTQKKFIKEVESGTPIKEAVKKVDPEQKRKENDERIRREMERERELREKTKFSTHVRKFHDITTGTKQQILDNMHLIPENVEIWVIYKKETAEEAKNVLNINTDLQIN